MVGKSELYINMRSLVLPSWVKQDRDSFQIGKRTLSKREVLSSDKSLRRAKKKLWNYYRNQVKALTEENIKGWDLSERSLYGKHIDHKISIRYGFKNDIPIEHIASPSNLRLVPAEVNMGKGIECLVDEDNQWILEQK